MHTHAPARTFIRVINININNNPINCEVYNNIINNLKDFCGSFDGLIKYF